MKLLCLTTILITFSLINGCATYVPPSSGPIATITPEYYTYYTIFQNAKQCTEAQSLAIDKPNKVSAGKLNTFMVGTRGLNSCPIKVFSFTPKVNNHYRLYYGAGKQSLKDTLIYGEKCVFKLTNTTTNKPVKYIIRNYTLPLFKNGYCSDKLAGDVI